MHKKIDRTDAVLWSVIAVYTGIIYATLSIVSALRKALVERFGYNVFDSVYWIFSGIGLTLLVVLLRKFRGMELLQKIAVLCLAATVYAYYLSGMRYAVERIHFLQYGLLGVLVYCAVRRHVPAGFSLIIASMFVYWLGLADEALQHLTASRVGEIGDSVINLISALLGIMVWYSLLDRRKEKRENSLVHARASLVCTGISTVATAVFLIYVHGFGYVVENLYTGRFYTSFKPSVLQEVQNGRKTLSPRERKIYHNEALRHLFQRDFYYTNDFLAADGSFYRNEFPSLFENRILETWYGGFLEKHEESFSGDLITPFSRNVAQKLRDFPVVWPEEVRNRMEESYGDTRKFYTSRVKSIIITSFQLKDLVFYCTIVFLILGFAWKRLSKATPARTIGAADGVPGASENLLGQGDG